jgi:hypothetical protein
MIRVTSAAQDRSSAVASSFGAAGAEFTKVYANAHGSKQGAPVSEDVPLTDIPTN